MAVVGTLIFCQYCGNLLDDAPKSKESFLACDTCGARVDEIPKITIVTRSKPTAFPSALRSKESRVRVASVTDAPTEATIKQLCDKCGRTEVRFYTQQLRSADEGTTVFYICDCGHKWNTNN